MQKSIVDQLFPNNKEIASKNREYLQILFKYVLWFSINELPTRGDDESDESLNQGKWKSFIKLQLETNPTFKHLHNQITSNRSIDYTSKTSFNGFITIIANAV